MTESDERDSERESDERDSERERERVMRDSSERE